MFLVILTTFLMPVTLIGTAKSIDKHVREFIAAMLVLEAGMLGAFVALDVFLFYVFWEVMLIPMYLLIGIWGGQRRLYASIKFVIYTMVGSLLMLVAIFYVYVQYHSVTGTYTTDLVKLMDVALPGNAQVWCFAAFGLAFAIKVPLFPLHTWLPDAHVEAPTAGSVILAGVLLKFGIYGFLRWGIPLFPHGAAAWAPMIAVLAVIGIVYGALVAFAQDDVKKLVAYSSVSHLGFCVLGLFSLTVYGTSGSIYAMLSHGLTTGGLFLGIGVLYERRHTRRLAEYGGIWKQMPVFAGLYLIIVMGSARSARAVGFHRRVPDAVRHVQRAVHVPARPRALPTRRALPRGDRDDRRDPRRDLLALHVPQGVLRQARQGAERQAAGSVGARARRVRAADDRHRADGAVPAAVPAGDGAVGEKFLHDNERRLQEDARAVRRIRSARILIKPGAAPAPTGGKR